MNRFLVSIATWIANSLLCFSRVVTKSKPYRRLHTLIQPSISFRSPDSRRSSSRSSRYCTRSFGGLPNRGPFSYIPRSLYQARFSLFRKTYPSGYAWDTSLCTPYTTQRTLSVSCLRCPHPSVSLPPARILCSCSVRL